MFSKAEVAQLKKEFWTTLGRLMKPHKSIEGTKVNWINYKTDVKNIYFRMKADNKKASIAIEITHQDETMRAIFFEQFEALKNYLHSILEEEWEWVEETHDDYGIPSAQIVLTLEGKNIFIKDNWPALFDFFKPRLIKLDEFWSDAKETFIALNY